MVGLGPERSMPPPQPLAIADGLLVTERRAEAWFTLATSNSDLTGEGEQEAELAEVIAAAERVLAGKSLHLKVLWGRITGETYADEVCPDPTSYGRAWTELRGERIDEMELPERHVLLGIHLTDRNTDASAETRRRASENVFGEGSRTIRKAELRHLDAQMIKLGRLLASTPWKARPASAETIGWMIGREQHRTATPIPAEGTISGASVARLTAGRVVPYSDHLRIYDGEGRVLAYSAVMAMTEFPEYMYFPGDGEWLRSVSDINRILDISDAADLDDDAELEVRVMAEVSMRFRLLSRKESRKTADKARTSAKEQRKSASKTSAEETSDAVAETEETMRALLTEISRDGLTLCEDHPRILVTEGSLEDLRAACAAVSSHYAGLGITCEVAENEQRELWLESLPGDMMRVPDLGHVHDIVGLFGASWWAGSRVGTGAPSVPVCGYLTGSTAGLVRNSLTSGSARGDATTTLYCGRSGRGKTSAMMLALIDAAASNAWVPFLDFKGDCGGAVTCAETFGIPSGLIRADASFAGAADLFQVLDPQDAILHVERQLALLTPASMRDAADRHLISAVTEISQQPNPTSADVIDLLANSSDPEARSLGQRLRGVASTPLGKTVAGRPIDGEVPKFRTDPGLWVIQFPGLSLPEPETSPETWGDLERVSMACFRGFTAWVINTMKDPALRRLPKLVGLPEVHMITALQDGRSFLSFIARLGRALGGSLAIDTQDPESIASITALVEQITTVFGFAQISKPQQQAMASLLLLDPEDPAILNRIRRINSRPDGSIRHGHCIMRDHMDDAATIQIDMPSYEVMKMLSTNPDDQHDRDDQAADLQEVFA